MHRYLLAAAVLAVAAPVEAKRIAAPPAPVVRAVRADVVFVGKVTAIEKDTVDAAPYPVIDRRPRLRRTTDMILLTDGA